MDATLVARQVPEALHCIPVPQLVPEGFAACVTPVAVVHASVVHGFPSSVTKAGPGRHCPSPLHVPVVEQGLPVAQGVPAFKVFVVAPTTGSQYSKVQALPSSASVRGVPASQTPASQVSLPLQTFPSLQLPPLNRSM
jgi:hypothetical protein